MTLVHSGVNWPAKALTVLCMAFGALVIGGFPASLLFQSSQPSTPLPWTALVGCLLFGTALVLAVQRMSEAAGRRAETLPSRLVTPLWIPLVFGVVLRLSTAMVLRAEPASDGSVYLSLARRLVAGFPYSSPLGDAYWPPGMPLFLASLLAGIGDEQTAILLYGVSCFLVAATGTWRLALAMGVARWSSVPVWLLAVWPTHVLCSGLPEKELLVVGLIPWILVFGIQAIRGDWWKCVACGISLGAAILVQPSLQLFPVVALVLAIAGTHERLRVLMTGTVVIVTMLLVISPWTYRNWQVLGSPVLVSTNGGGNLYRANNSKATGGYVAVGEVDLSRLNELDGDRIGRRLALEWITSHPTDFLRLSGNKMFLFVGDDSYGVYATMRVGGVVVPNGVYPIAKLVAALPWIVGWAFIAMVVSRASHRADFAAKSAVLLLPFGYLLGIHAVFESGGKYHLPTLAPFLVLLVLAARSTGYSDTDTPSEIR